MRRVAGRVHWPSALIGAVAASLLMTAAPVVADVGDAVLQGKFNSVNQRTALGGSVAGESTLKVANSAGTGTGITVQVASGQAPLVVNSGKRVKRLNADKLDGLSSLDLMPGGNTPEGVTIRGTYSMGGSAAGANALVTSEISFGYEFPFAPVAHYINLGAIPPSDCPGSWAAPEAAPGHLCVYESSVANAAVRDVNGPTGDGSAFQFGARLFLRSAAGGLFSVLGTWAATSGGVAPGPGDAGRQATNLGVAD